MLRPSQFFRDNQGMESMTALLLFLSFWPATYVMVVQHSENLYYAYMAAYAGLAANKQWVGRNAGNVAADELADSGVGAGSIVTSSSTVVSQPLAQSVKPVRGGKGRTR